MGALAADLVAQTAVNPGKVVEIDGSKDPARIPEHLLWRTVFRYLARRGEWPPVGMATLRSQVRLTDEEFRVLFETADIHQRSEADISDRMKVQYDRLRRTGGEAGEIVRAAQEIELEGRVKRLALADVMLERLSEYGRASLLVWVNNWRKSISVTIPEAELLFFRLPR